MTDFNQIIRDGKIVDNKRTKSINMKEVLKTMAQDSESFKCAVGYFYIEGLFEIINSLKDLKEIKILMGYDTSKPTKEQLIKAFNDKFNELEVNEQTRPAVKLFYQLVREYKTLKIKVYFGDEKNPERLHSKAYLFLRDSSATNILNRYMAGVIGSSNLTPSGLVGNTELNTIITEQRDLEDVEKWFEELWGKGTEDFEKLNVCEALAEAIEKSKFGEELRNTFVYIEPKEFLKILIKFLKADYLFEEFKESKLLQFQYIDFVRVLNNFNSKGYRGCFLTSSVGLGKSYVAAQVAKYFIDNKEKVLIIAPAGLVHSEDQWQRYLKEFKIYDKVSLVSMGDLQKRPDMFRFEKYSRNYGLIIVDEAHNYRNPDSYRARNIKKIIDENGNSKVLFLTATPVNTSLDDLFNLAKLFQRKGDNLLFDNLVRELGDLINLFKNKEYEELKNSEKEELSIVQERIEREMFVKSTRETIKTQQEYIDELKIFSKVDITKIKDPDVEEIKYELDTRYRDVVAGIVDFITSLSAAHLRLLDPEKGSRLGGFFKWVLYKRFESDISSYYLTLKRLSKKSTMILTAVEKKNTKYLEEDEYEDDIDINFDLDFKDRLNDVIEKIKLGEGAEHIKILSELERDIGLINKQIEKLNPFLKEGCEVLFKNDQKINQLSSILSSKKGKKILLFTEYKDTLRAIKEYFNNSLHLDEVRYVDSNTKNKQAIIEKFNDSKDKLRILMTTDTLSEGFNISGADVVINFDIPYNPVRIIQRIGRATRLDNPKDIEVLNFRPDDDLDVELKLVERMELRIKDIIRFVGVEYRIWFETEKEVLSERRAKDKRMYLEVWQKIRSNFRGSNFKELEITLDYSKPILIFLQRAIKKYSIKKEDLEGVKIPSGKNYTIFGGIKGLNLIYKDSDSYNEETLYGREITELNKRIDFEKTFRQELKDFEDFKSNKKKEDLKMQYFNDSTDKLVNSILDFIVSKKLLELYPEISKLEDALEQIKHKCGSTTEKIIRKIKVEIKESITKDKINKWTHELTESFTKTDIQKKIDDKKETLFAIGFIEE
ncbi:MAG: helicase-related protein [Candidatus Pacearchaeota archaeon]|nr:helicase-related protein [Candidatus Pacearchaeota archaeon]